MKSFHSLQARWMLTKLNLSAFLLKLSGVKLSILVSSECIQPIGDCLTFGYFVSWTLVGDIKGEQNNYMQQSQGIPQWSNHSNQIMYRSNTTTLSDTVTNQCKKELTDSSLIWSSKWDFTQTAICCSHWYCLATDPHKF